MTDQTTTPAPHAANSQSTISPTQSDTSAPRAAGTVEAANAGALAATDHSSAHTRAEAEATRLAALLDGKRAAGGSVRLRAQEAEDVQAALEDAIGAHGLLAIVEANAAAQPDDATLEAALDALVQAAQVVGAAAQTTRSDLPQSRERQAAALAAVRRAVEATVTAERKERDDWRAAHDRACDARDEEMRRAEQALQREAAAIRRAEEADAALAARTPTTSTEDQS